MGEPRSRRWAQVGSLPVDVLVVPAALAIDVLVFSTSLAGREPATGSTRLLVIGYAFVAAALLVWRRRAPLPVFIGLAAHSLLARWLIPVSHPTACLLVGLVAVARLRPARESVPALAVTFLVSAFVVQEAVATEPDPTLQAGTLIAAGGAYLLIDTGAWAVGRWSGRTGRRMVELEQRRKYELERERVSAAETLAAERARIARELHDIVAHSVTVMVLHAAGARGVLDRAPERAAQSLTTIEEMGTQAMDELRRLLGVLRDSGAAGSVGEDPVLAGLAQLDGLVESVRKGGIAVTVEVTGAPARLDPSVDLAAYRVLQEGLTNVTRYAGPGTGCSVRLAWGQDELVLTVRDDGAGTVAPGVTGLSTGHGLLGLRERVAIVGGALRAEAAGNGYVLEAWLPLRRATAADTQGTVPSRPVGEV